MIRFRALKQQLNKEIKDIYGIFGDESFLKERALMLIKEFSKVDIDSIESYIYSVENAGDIFDAVNSYSMFSEKKLIIIKEIDLTVQDFKKYKFEGLLKNKPEENIVVFVGNKKISELEKIDNSELVDCSRDEDLINVFINHDIKEKNGTIEQDAVRLLNLYCLGNLTRISLEIEKLLSLSNGCIKKEHVESIVRKEVDYQVFALTDAFGRGDKKEAINIVNELLSTGTKEYELFGLLYGFLRRIKYATESDCSTNEIAEHLGVKEYPIKIAKGLGQVFDMAIINKALKIFQENDINFKSGRYNMETAFWNCFSYLLLNLGRKQ